MPEYQVPNVQIVAQPDDQVSFQLAGQEKLRWHFSDRYPRPCFFPVLGPSGRSLTRMGHPAAPNHDHHRSFWFGHRDVGGVNFWEERGGNQKIRQESWEHYQDGDQEAGMVVRLGWFDAHNARLLRQNLIVVYKTLPQGEGWLELQTEFSSEVNKLVLGRTNFGLLGMRMAASISRHYGGGILTSSEGGRGEQPIFSKPARWMDYSGPITRNATEGITWFDHPRNPHYPTSWHVRDDGWMSAAFNLRNAVTLVRNRPLRLRYGFHIHSGPLDRNQAERQRQAFDASAEWEVVRAERPWRVHLQRRKNGTSEE